MDSVTPATQAPFSLLETMRVEHGRVERLERHMARMADAATYFAYQWSESTVRDALAAVAREHPQGTWRLRLLVSVDGRPSIECTPHADETRPWRVDFARDPIDPADPFIRHKTTRRRIYEDAKRSNPDLDDVLLWNDRGEVTESTIGNVVAKIDGVRYTPPLSSGLLGGTFRAEQLEAGTIREHVLTKADITSASRLWLINSVRRWVDVILVVGGRR
jgi:para-aminobenzoate synthetase / 4-amino-4-deoxychorismate lyase